MDENLEDIVYDERVDRFHFRLKKDGKLWLCTKKTNAWVEVPWYKQEKSGKTWFPKRKNFMSLLKWAVRDGDYDQY